VFISEIKVTASVAAAAVITSETEKTGIQTFPLDVSLHVFHLAAITST